MTNFNTYHGFLLMKYMLNQLGKDSPETQTQNKVYTVFCSMSLGQRCWNNACGEKQQYIVFVMHKRPPQASIYMQMVVQILQH